MDAYVYVDGESHWIRSEHLWKKLHGGDAELTQIVGTGSGGSINYPTPSPATCAFAAGKFFWDPAYPALPEGNFRHCHIQGATYFTACTGDEDDLHNVRLAIRQYGFEPQVLKERATHAKSRKHQVENSAIIEKPKGVDIGLTVRLIEDAYHHNFNICYLFTSDVDFVPVICSIQRVGRKVVVFGYRDGIGKNSELEYVPDAFIDLTNHMGKYTLRKA